MPSANARRLTSASIKRKHYVPHQVLIYIVLITIGYLCFSKHEVAHSVRRKLYPMGPSCDEDGYQDVYDNCQSQHWHDTSSCDDTTNFYKCLQEETFACYEYYVPACHSNITSTCSGLFPECTCQSPQLYPSDLFFEQPYCVNEHATDGAAVILHVIGILYMFLALSVVCDEYFCGALDIMVERWQVKPDVAGATFMAAGGSAPELFTSLMGVFFSESDVGFGTIVGSAVFNVLFVIGLCAAFAKSVLELTWWPLFRDCSYYLISLSALTICASDKTIYWFEALILFLMYCVYVGMMKYNDQLEAFWGGILFGKKAGTASALVVPTNVDVDPEAPKDPALAAEARDKVPGLSPKGGGGSADPLTPGRRSMSMDPSTPSAKHVSQIAKREVGRQIRRGSIRLTSARSAIERKRGNSVVKTNMRVAAAMIHLHHQVSSEGMSGQRDQGDGMNSTASKLKALAKQASAGGEEEKAADGGGGGGRGGGGGMSPMAPPDEAAGGMAAPDEAAGDAVVALTGDGDVEAPKKPAPAAAAATPEPQQAKGPEAAPAEKEAEKGGEEEEEEEAHDPFEVPDTWKERAVWLATLPLVATLHFAIPNCSNPKHEDKFLLTFGLSLLWIALFSFLLVWWATVWGAVLGIEDIIMGLTFLAAGTSIPDAVSSVVMARIGEGDMAVSSSIGSNIFDILFGLPVPWFLATGVVAPIQTGKTDVILVQSDYIVSYVLLLMIMVFLVIGSIMWRHWKLDKALGAMMAGLYAVFLVIAITIETSQPKALAF